MKTEPNDFAYATPEAGTDSFSTWQGQTGLTKREYFMAMAIQGLCANTNYSPNEIKNGACVDISEAAIYVVDAAINALNDNP